MKSSILLFGGRSDERLVSVASAQNLSGQFDFGELWYMDPQGRVATVSRQELADHQRPFEVQFHSSHEPFCESVSMALPRLKGKVVFLGLHGTEGEDGTLQDIFESARIPFTGSGSRASRDCFDKLRAKRVVGTRGVRVAPELVLRKGQAHAMAKELEDFLTKHGRVVIKPIASGSSFGLQFLSSAAEIPKALNVIESSAYADYLIEAFIQGRELTVGVYEGRAGVRALPPSEVVVSAGHSFDYQGKYLGRGTTEITPADLAPRERDEAQRLAVEAHRALGCAGYTRTDMILTGTGDGPVFLETNTLPGMSKASFIPQQLRAAGLTIGDFLREQLELASRRYGD